MSQQPNIIVFMGDQWRRQSLGFMNCDPVITPNFDRFAAEATAVERAYCCYPLCTPARASFFTGRYPQTLSMMYNWQRLPAEVPNLATVLGEQGYDTALIGKWHMDDWEETDRHGDMWNTMTPPGPRRCGIRYWYSNGCNHDHFTSKYLDTEGNYVEKREWTPTHETTRAIDYIRNTDGERPSGKPFFLWLSTGTPHNGRSPDGTNPTGDPHEYYAPQRFEALYRDPQLPAWHPDTDLEPYRRQAPGHFGCITSMDEEFGRLMACLDQQGLRDNTIVLVTADHGEMLGIHGRWMKDIWFEESIGIPFVIRWPGHIPPNTRSQLCINMIDVMPTMLGLAGVDTPRSCHGRDFSATVRGESDATRALAFLCFNTGAPPGELTRWEFPDESGRYWRGVRSRRYTYVVVDQREQSLQYFYRPGLPVRLRDDATCVLYDHDSDPWQMNPIYPGQGYDDVMGEHHEQLSTWLDSVNDDFLTRYWRATRP